MTSNEYLLAEEVKILSGLLREREWGGEEKCLFCGAGSWEESHAPGCRWAAALQHADWMIDILGQRKAEDDGDDPYEEDDSDDTTPHGPPTTPLGKALARAYEPAIAARFAETYDWMHSFGKKEIGEINIRLEKEKP